MEATEDASFPRVASQILQGADLIAALSGGDLALADGFGFELVLVPLNLLFQTGSREGLIRIDLGHDGCSVVPVASGP